nr:hypothetical protein [Bradyrhizobium sp. CCBAU 21359]
MVGDPLLIRRPLIDIGGARFAGLDHESALSLLGRKTQEDLACTKQTPRVVRRPEETKKPPPGRLTSQR